MFRKAVAVCDECDEKHFGADSASFARNTKNLAKDIEGKLKTVTSEEKDRDLPFPQLSSTISAVVCWVMPVTQREQLATISHSTVPQVPRREESAWTPKRVF